LSAAEIIVASRLACAYDLPSALHVNNGPEFISTTLDGWANRVKLA
jgi:hypothetical protein